MAILRLADATNSAVTGPRRAHPLTSRFRAPRGNAFDSCHPKEAYHSMYLGATRTSGTVH